MQRKDQNLSILTGHLPEPLKESSIKVFIDGFGQKIDHLMLNPHDSNQAKRVYRDGADFTSGIYALCEGKLVGLIGLQFQRQKFIHLNLTTLHQEFGFWGGVTRKLSGSVFKDLHPLKDDELRVQVISVAGSFRGTGVGHRLLEALFAWGKARHLTCVRLEVVNTNPQAKKLYHELGFTRCGWLPYGPIASKAGFSSQFLMKKEL
ncbi:GNAT family N-acetyltransferase [Desulfoluna sp.]|uniref:GNAT family N-acetyltransferase n=1 Tax=Desulfoluna sp. TaxID=2045199 RepID=UPI00261818EE|nr:GNAT family N-acetyltransferase [Desulfoluna sp.]